MCVWFSGRRRGGLFQRVIREIWITGVFKGSRHLVVDESGGDNEWGCVCVPAVHVGRHG